MDLMRSTQAKSWLAAGGASLFLLFAVFMSWIGILPPGTVPKLFDLESYRATLNAVADGALMFDWLGYPPVTLILLSPLRGLPELAGDRLWTGASILMILGLAAALAKVAMDTSRGSGEGASGVRDRSGFLAAFGLAGTMLLMSLPAHNQLMAGQLQLTVITLAFLDAAGVLPHKCQGTLVGLAAAFKLTPLIFLPYYLITRQWRQAGMATVSFAVATGIGFALFPGDSLYFWTHADSSGRLGTSRIDNLSVLGVLSRWMPDPDQAKMVWYGLALALGLAAFWRAWQHFRRGEQMEAALVIGCASTAIGPVAWPHYQLWLPLAALWVLMSGARRTMIVGALIYLPYSVLVALPLYFVILTYDEQLVGVIARIFWEFAVLVPTLICILGLPHRGETVRGTKPVAHAGPPTGRATAETRAFTVVTTKEPTSS